MIAVLAGVALFVVLLIWLKGRLDASDYSADPGQPTQLSLSDEDRRKLQAGILMSGPTTGLGGH